MMLNSQKLPDRCRQIDDLFQVILKLESDKRNGRIMDWKISRENDINYIYIKPMPVPDHIEFYLDCSLKDC